MERRRLLVFQSFCVICHIILFHCCSIRGSTCNDLADCLPELHTLQGNYCSCVRCPKHLIKYSGSIGTAGVAITLQCYRKFVCRELWLFVSHMQTFWTMRMIHCSSPRGDTGSAQLGLKRLVRHRKS